MKKFILILMSLLFAAGCTGPANTTNSTDNTIDNPSPSAEPSKDVAGEVQPVMTSYDIYDTLPAELMELVSNTGGAIDPSMMSLIGVEFPALDVVDYNENTFNPSELHGKKVVYEIVASWCGYCQQWTKDIMDNVRAANDDIEIIQIFGDGEKDAVEEFYTTVGKTVGDKTVIPNSEQVNNIVYGLGIYSFPSFVFVNEEGTVVWAASGYLEEETFNKQLEIAYGDKNAYGMLGEDYIKSMQRTYADVKEELYDETVAKIETLKPDYLESAYWDYIVYSDLNKNIAPEQIVTMDGETVLWEEMKNNKMLFNFIGAADSEDIFTKENNEVMKQISEKYPEYTIVNFLLQYSENTIEDFYADTDIEFAGHVVNTNSIDMPESIYKTSIFMIPSLYFVNEDGHVAGVYAGELTMETFEAAKDIYFAETPVYINK